MPCWQWTSSLRAGSGGFAGEGDALVEHVLADGAGVLGRQAQEAEAAGGELLGVVAVLDAHVDDGADAALAGDPAPRRRAGSRRRRRGSGRSQ